MRNWAVVCGAIRSPIEFNITMNAVMEFRRQGLLDGIVVSTWNDAFTDQPELKQELLGRGIIVVEVPGLREGGNGQTFRQHRLFEAGLAHCPDGVAVLKLRTDKAVHRLHYFIERLKNGPVATLPGQSVFQLMQAKVSVQAASVSMPFNHADVVFYGLKSDLSTMLHMDHIYDWAFFPGSMNAEIRWFSRPFLRQIKFFRQFFEYFNCRAVSSYVLDLAETGRLRDAPDIVLDAVAANMLCIHYNFDIASPDTGTEKPSVRHLFGFGDKAPSKVIPMTMTRQAACYSNKAVAAFVHGAIDPFEGGGKLLEAFGRMADDAYLARTITLKEVKDIHQSHFGATELDNSAKSVMRLASNVSIAPDAQIDKPLPISLDLPDGGQIAEDVEAFQQAFIVENAVRTDLATLYFQLSEKFRTGDGVVANADLARYWLSLAAEGRHRPAEKAWGDVQMGEGNFESAAGWYHRAALRGDKDAQMALALLLRDNDIESVKESWEKWMALAEEGKQPTELPL